jgi:hypothetical protein
VRSPVVGTWLARVERPSGTIEVGLHFTATGLVFLFPSGQIPGGHLPGTPVPGGRLPGGFGSGGHLPGTPVPGGHLPGGFGSGSWEPEPRGDGPGETIVYRIKEAIIGEDGDYLGYIDICQSASVTAGNLLSSSGQSQVYGPEGVLTRTVPVRISAVPKGR